MGLEEIRAERARIAKARAEREQAEAEAALLAAEELALRNESAIEDTTRKLGRRGVLWDGVDGGHVGVILLQRPDPGELKKYTETPGNSVDAVHNFVLTCVVYPDKAAAGKILEQMPGLLVPCQRVIDRLAGAAAVELGKAR